MGTSKGYIAPTTLHWSKAKRAVTSFINNRDYDSKAKAASKYATAMKTDMSTGEVGLDFSKKSYISCNKQCIYFEKIAKVCAEKNKLMSVHLRRAEKEAISILKEYRPRRCIIHWFNGSREQLQQLLDIGCYFSLNSNMVTNEKSKEKLYLIPKTRVLIESDGPFTKIDGKKYTFNNLIKIYELVARYYNEPDIIKIVHDNFRDVLSK